MVLAEVDVKVKCKGLIVAFYIMLCDYINVISS